MPVRWCRFLLRQGLWPHASGGLRRRHSRTRGRHRRGDSHRLERHQRHRDQQTDRGQAQAPRNTPAGTAGLCAPSCSGAGRGPDLRLDFSATPAVRPDRGLQVAAPSRAFSVVDQRCSRGGRMSAWVGTSSLVQVSNHRGAAAPRVRGGLSWVAGSRSQPRHRPGRGSPGRGRVGRRRIGCR